MNTRRLATLAALCALTPAILVRAADEPAASALAKAPAAVRATVAKSLAGHTLAEFGKSKLGDDVVYEAGYKVDGTDHSVIVGQAGNLVQEEEDVEVSQVPAAAMAAVKKAEPTGKVDEAARAKADGVEFYSVDVKVGDVTHVVNVKADGTLIADKVESAAE